MAKDRQLTPEERHLWRQEMGHEPKDRKPRIVAEPAAPAPAKREPKTPLDVATGRKAARQLKPGGPVEATLDLHGLGKVDAYSLVQDFIDRAQREGLRHVLIITGKGRTSEGILRANLPHWLNEPHLRRRVSAITQARPEKGGSGVFHVLLKRR